MLNPDKIFESFEFFKGVSTKKNPNVEAQTLHNLVIKETNRAGSLTQAGNSKIGRVVNLSGAARLLTTPNWGQHKQMIIAALSGKDNAGNPITDAGLENQLMRELAPYMATKQQINDYTKIKNLIKNSPNGLQLEGDTKSSKDLIKRMVDYFPQMFKGYKTGRGKSTSYNSINLTPEQTKQVYNMADTAQKQNIQAFGQRWGTVEEHGFDPQVGIFPSSLSITPQINAATCSGHDCERPGMCRGCFAELGALAKPTATQSGMKNFYASLTAGFGPRLGKELQTYVAKTGERNMRLHPSGDLLMGHRFLLDPQKIATGNSMPFDDELMKGLQQRGVQVYNPDGSINLNTIKEISTRHLAGLKNAFSQVGKDGKPLVNVWGYTKVPLTKSTGIPVVDELDKNYMHELSGLFSLPNVSMQISAPRFEDMTEPEAHAIHSALNAGATGIAVQHGLRHNKDARLKNTNLEYTHFPLQDEEYISKFAQSINGRPEHSQKLALIQRLQNGNQGFMISPCRGGKDMGTGEESDDGNPHSCAGCLRCLNLNKTRDVKNVTSFAGHPFLGGSEPEPLEDKPPLPHQTHYSKKGAEQAGFLKTQAGMESFEARKQANIDKYGQTYIEGKEGGINPSLIKSFQFQYMMNGLTRQKRASIEELLQIDK